MTAALTAAYGDRGIEGWGDEAGGYFEDLNGSGYAYVGFGDLGIEAYGNTAGARFEDADDMSIAYVADGQYGISAYGQEAGGYFEDQDGSSHAFVGHGTYGISAVGDDAGGYFEDTEGYGYAYVGRDDAGIEGYGLTGGYFESAEANGYAYVGCGPIGIWSYGRDTGGFFEDTSSGTWSRVAVGSDKIQSNGSCDFVQNHPGDPEAVVVYACPEGDEVATYTRGTARLQNGAARVPLGETFKWVTNPDIGLTAHLTPRGDCEGLYVESLTTEQMVVRELHDGMGAVTFDYLVYGLRIGFEEVSVVQEKTQEAYIPSMADHRALYERRPELRDYNALARFKRMRADIGETEPLDLSNSQALHDAIVEFDPAVHSRDHRRESPAPEAIETGEDQPRRQRPDRPGPVDPKNAEIAQQCEQIEDQRERISAQQVQIGELIVRLERLETLLGESPNGAKGGAR